MIQIKIDPVENIAAVLAGIVIPLENVVPRKLHFLLGQPIKKEKNDDARDPNLPRDGRDQFVVGRRRRKVTPAGEIVGEKTISLIRGNHLSMARVNQRKSTTRRANINRLPQAIQNQHLTI